jgi:ParB/RepB/Spo0J family partition protein
MRRVKTGNIKIRDLRFLENSRLRAADDVSDLMQDIQQRGLLENIGVRRSDNAIIFGNRRVKAFQKLGYEEIPADFYDDVTDEELMITNLAENIKRKNIGSIEIGRICKLLQHSDMTYTEIAQKLGISVGRVQSCITAYNVTVGTPFENIISSGTRGKEAHGIPESLLWDIQNSLTRARRLSKEDWTVLLKAAEKKELTKSTISTLRKIIMIDPTMDMEEALELLKKCRVVSVLLPMNEAVLNRHMKDERFSSESEFVKNIIREYDKALLF